MKKMVLNLFVIFLVIGIVILKLFFYDYMLIQGNSMNDAYRAGDVVLLEKRCHDLRRYDVVIVNVDNVGMKEKIIKRIVGLPMETVQILDGYLFIDGVRLEDDVVDIKMDYAGIADDEITLACDEYFLLGDNRNESIDSRSEWLGTVSREQILGRVFIKIFERIR